MKVKQILIVLSIVIFCSVASYRLGVLAQMTGALKSIVEPGSMVTEASYVVFTDGNNYYARNGNTGEIEFSGTDAGTVIQSAINTLTNGGDIFLKNTLDVSSPITLRSKITLHSDNKGGLKAVALMDYLLLFNNFNENITVKGLVLDGNNKSKSVINSLYNKNVNIDSCEIKNALGGTVGGQSAAIFLDRPTNSWVTTNYVHDVGQGGITIYGGELLPTYPCHNVYILNNIVEDFEQNAASQGPTYKGGISVIGGGVTNNDSYNFYVKDNIVRMRSLPTDLNDRRSINIVLGVSKVYVVNNLIENCVLGFDIECEGTNRCPSNLVLQGNILSNIKLAVSVADKGTFGFGFGGPNTKDVIVDSNLISNVGDPTSVLDRGISLIDLTNFQVRNNRIVGTNGVLDYAVYLDGTISGIDIIDNNFENVKSIYQPEKARTIKYNTGYVTENSSTASYTGSATSFTVSHGLTTTPKIVTVTPQQSGQGKFWVTDKNAATFTINFDTAPGASTWYFDWYAEV